MHTIGEHLSAALAQSQVDPEAPVLLDDTSNIQGDQQSAPPPAIPGNTPPAPPKPAENESKPRAKPGKPGDPDVGPVHYHTVNQGVITFRTRLQEWVLAPWQVIPFSEGYEILSEKLAIRYHRSVYQVGPNGEPMAETVGAVSYAKHSWAYVTPADTICGFSGLKFNRMKVTCDRVRFLRDRLSTLDPEQQPWAAHPVEKIDLRPVLPRFWVELEEPAGGFRSANIPFSTKQDVTTGEVLRNLVPLEHWHLLAPIPGVTSEMVSLCEREHGNRFLVNRIYLAGTGIGPDQNWKSTGDAEPVLLRLDDLTNPALGKLTSVITPCLIPERKPKGKDQSKQKTETPPSGEQHEMFSIPSLTALRNMLGDRMVAGTCVFAN